MARLSHSSFFHTVEPPAALAHNGFVDLGGNGDCGYRAFAAGLIRNLQIHPNSYKGAILKTLLNRHFKLFPEHRTMVAASMDDSERMACLIKNVRLSDLIASLAYTLRQLAVDEVCQYPARYQGAFVLDNEGTAPELMRQPGTWIDESCIAALSEVFQTPIEVQVVERRKTIPNVLYYNSEAKNPKIELQLQNSHYTVKVPNETFGAVRDNPVRALNPVVDTKVVDPSLEEVLQIIEDENNRMVQVFEETYHRLASGVVAGELDIEQLLAVYVSGMGKSDYLTGRVACVGVEQGNQEFFDAIEATKRGRGAPKGVLPGVDSRERMIKELVHALSRAISIGHMSEDQVFANIDEIPGSRKRSLS